MAKRRFLEKQPLTEAEGLTTLIMMGVGLTPVSYTHLTLPTNSRV